MSDFRFLIPYASDNELGGFVVYEDKIITYPDRPNEQYFNVNQAAIQFGMQTFADGGIIHRHLPLRCNIGNYSAIAKNVGFMGLQTHRYDVISNMSYEIFRDGVDDVVEWALEKNKFTIDIGNDVWIGYGAMLLPGANIPDGVVIGANAVISKPLEPYGIYVGNPARLLKFRFDENVVEKLLAYRWWDYSPLLLSDIKKLFFKPPNENYNFKDEFFEFLDLHHDKKQKIEYKKTIIAKEIT
jgi:acetyltransferase-like isoleucine patch superfamily enzyme